MPTILMSLRTVLITNCYSDNITTRALCRLCPTGMRKSWVLKAAAAGWLPVLCEKPVAIECSDAQEMIDACAAAGVQFMDGVMSITVNASLRCESLLYQSGSDRWRIQTHFWFNGGEEFAKSNATSSEFEFHMAAWAIWVGTVSDFLARCDARSGAD